MVVLAGGSCCGGDAGGVEGGGNAGGAGHGHVGFQGHINGTSLINLSSFDLISIFLFCFTVEPRGASNWSVIFTAFNKHYIWSTEDYGLLDYA